MLIILDRDGVINRDLPQGVLRMSAFDYLPRSLEAIAALTRAGHRLCIATNQSAVGKGLMTQATLDAIHAHLLADVQATGGQIAHIYAATDAPDAPSDRRKPAPGMLLEAMREHNATKQETIFIGDALTDLIAAREAGCRSILVLTGKGMATAASSLFPEAAPIAVCDDLWHAQELMLAL